MLENKAFIGVLRMDFPGVFWYSFSMRKAGGNPKSDTDLSGLSREELLEKYLQLQDLTRQKETLEETCLQLKKQVSDLQMQIGWMSEQLALSNKKTFGSSSEKTSPEQLSFFNEAESLADSKLPEPQVEEITYKRKKRKGKREEDLKGLPLEIVEYALSETECTCPQCGEHLHQMSKEIRSELVFVPAQFKKVQHERLIYSCRNCEKKEIATPVIKAPAPAALIKGSIASASLVAGIINGKYVNSLPLYRQEKEFQRQGIYLPRQNMANWLIRCADDYFVPIYERLRHELLTNDILHADETTMQVLKEPGRKPTCNSYMWLYRTGPSDRPVVLFEYQQTRAAEHPKTFLSGYHGYLQVDGYAAYHTLPKEIRIVGCFAHARRKFDEALKIMSEKDRLGSKAERGLQYCNALFAIERDIQNLSDTERTRIRDEKSVPILEEFHEWLQKIQPQMLPKSKMGKAIHYALDQWEYLTGYLLDPRLSISNNLAEQSIRPFTIGRKNSLFSDTPKGAFTSAVIYSLVETAKANGLKPYIYFQYLLSRMPNLDFKNNPEKLESLLPWSADLPEDCRLPADSAKNSQED